MTLLEVLREDLGVRAVKDGCSPQGQCGCCTVLIDGSPRVACVTPLRRVAGRSVTTVDGLDASIRDRLVAALIERGGSQCGFCTPGIVTRLAALAAGAGAAQVESALLAHLCRCTGWRSIVDAALDVAAAPPAAASGAARDGMTAAPPVAASAVAAPPVAASGAARERTARRERAEARAALEGAVAQAWGPHVVVGRAGFADDTAPAGALVAVPRAGVTRAELADPAAWALGRTLAEARAGAGQIQGRRSGGPLVWPVALPPGDWAVTLQTTWVEPAYLETDASWCVPGGEPASPVANGGAFGAKTDSPAPAAAAMLAAHLARPVRVVLSREDAVRLGSKRPPAAGGVGADGRGRLVLLHPAGPGPLGSVQNIAVTAVERTESGAVPALATSLAVRAAGWAEATVLAAVAEAVASGRQPEPGRRPPGGARAAVTGVDGGRADAEVTVDADGWPAGVVVDVDGGDPLDAVTAASYVQGAAHMALGWVCSEGLAVGDDGRPTDLTVRSFGVLRARDTPALSVRVRGSGPAVPVADAAFAAVAAATWMAQGLPSRWPTMRGTRR